jgi:hypothetical protein
MFACTVYVLYDVCFILVIVSFKSSVELVCIVYYAPNLNKAFEKKKKKKIRKNGSKKKKIKNN